jgi:hypothetical protein
MLKEWMQNLPIETLRGIAADTKVAGSWIWQLAVVELMVRESRDVLAA